MLDKSIPYKNIIMQMSSNVKKLTGSEVNRVKLPPPYTLRFYRPGDEAFWSEIETSVDEFPAEEKALQYFAVNFLPFTEDLQKRQLFICDENQRPIATTTVWWDAKNQNFPMLHWVAVRPDHQGKGLGKAIIQQALSVSEALSPEQGIYLHTQTWSHPAIRLYHSLGFRIVRTGPFQDSKNDFAEAALILKNVYGERIWQTIFSETVSSKCFTGIKK